MSINIDAVYISGFFIFLTASIFYIVLYFFDLYRGERRVKKYLKDHGDHWTLNKSDVGVMVKDSKGESRKIPLHLFILRWNRFTWVFFCMFSITLLLTLLYASLWLGQGLALKPNSLIITWGRWLIFTICSVLVVSCYSLFVAKLRYTPQSFFSIFHGFLSILFILFATLSQTRETSILWMIASLVTAFFTTLLFLFPNNTLLKRAKSIRRRFSWKRTIFVSTIILAYWLYFIIWVLSESNELTTVLNFGGENLAYLIIDIVMVYFVLTYLISLVFRKTKIDHNRIIFPDEVKKRKGGV